MINFLGGTIIFHEKNFLAASDEDLVLLAEKGVIEKRKDAIGIYYHFKDEVNGMRFGVFISVRERKANWVRLSWLDSPCKEWEDVSKKSMMDEYRLLLDFIEKEVGGKADHKINRKSTWTLKWGQLEVSYETRAYQADIFMKFG